MADGFTKEDGWTEEGRASDAYSRVVSVARLVSVDIIRVNMIGGATGES